MPTLPPHAEHDPAPAPSRLRWGIVGTGVIANQFAADLNHVKQACLSAVASRSQDNAQAFAGQFGCQAFTSVEALLECGLVDAVYVATPNHAHFEAASKALKAGKAVVVEKPMAPTAAQAGELVRLAREFGVFLMEGMWTRFLPSVDHLRKAVLSGAIGQVRSIQADLAFHHPYDPANRFFDVAQGGGVLLDLGVYLISLTLDLLGKPTAVTGCWKAAPGGADMAADIVMSYPSAIANLHCNFNKTGANLFRVEGAHGTLVLQPPFIGSRKVLEFKGFPARQIEAMCHDTAWAGIFNKVAGRIPVPGVTRHDFDFEGYGLRYEIEAATQAISAGLTESRLSPLGDSLETLTIIESMRTASHK